MRKWLPGLAQKEELCGGLYTIKCSEILQSKLSESHIENTYSLR